MPTAFFNDAAQEVAASDGFVVRTGKYFECGKEFTDKSGKKFTLSEQEADDAAAAFTGGDINLEHQDTVLSGLLGRVGRIWRDGKDVLAEFRIPKWLHEATGGKPLKTSSEWDMEAKRALGAGLVLKPAVKDAVMMAAFSEGHAPLDTLLAFAMTRHNTPEGQMAMQDIHDMASRSGAVCDRSNVAKMASQHEATAVQKIHDIAADHGATCKSGDKPAYYFEKETKPMTDWKKLVAHFKKQGMSDADAAELQGDLTAQFSAPSGMTPAEKADAEATKKKLAAAEATIARMSESTTQKDAESFLDTQEAAGRTLPYERPILLAQFSRAAQDDAAARTIVKFAAYDDKGEIVQKEGSRVDELKAVLMARMPSPMMREHFGDGRTLTSDDIKIVFGEGHGKSPAEKAADQKKAEEDELSKSEAGRRVLDARNGKH